MMVQNPWVHDLNLQNIMAMFTEQYRANWHPLVWLSHGIDFALLGNDPGKHHLMNVAYHAVNGCLVYFLAQFFIKNKYSRATVGFGAALLFLIHPQHVQSVAWVVERKDTLSVMFSLLFLIGWMNSGEKKKHLLLLPLFACALMAKAMAVTLPVILVLIELQDKQRVTSVKSLMLASLPTAPYFLLALVVGIITLNTQSYAMVSIESLPIPIRVLNALNNSVLYIQHYLIPFNLSPFYGFPATKAEIYHWTYWLPGLALIVTSLLFAVLKFQKGIRWPLGVVLFYYVTILPVSGLIHVGPAKALDYYAYFATLPFGLMISFVFFRLFGRFQAFRPVLIPLAAFYLIILVALTSVNMRFWKDDLTLWSRTFELQPESAYVNRNLAGAYAAAGELSLAMLHAKLSLQYGGVDDGLLAALEAHLQKAEAARMPSDP